MDDGEKTEEPTAKKLADAHKKGQFAKSSEIGTAFIIAATFILFVFAGKDRMSQVGVLAIGVFSHLHDLPINEVTAATTLNEFIRSIFFIIAPLLLFVTIASILSGGLQSGFKLTPDAMEAKLSKLDPIGGFKKIFNKRSLVQLGVDIGKMSAMGAILYGLIKRILNDPIFSSPVGTDYVANFLFELVLQMLVRLLLVIVVIAAIDYFWQRHKTHEELKMTKQEVKDEIKNREGNPQVKQAQRRMAFRLLQKQMMKSVPTADVVVTNPTHFAVALKYERGVDSAPVILAKGQGAFAQRLKAIAREHEVPMVENKPVARMLYKVGQVGKTIPIELFEVVARILAHVYKTHRYYFYQLRSRRLAMKAE